MSIKDKLNKFFHDKTKGLVRLDQKDVDEIISIVKSSEATATLYRYIQQHESWSLINTVQVSNETIKEALADQLGVKPVENCYKWELKNSLGDWEGNIFTLNSSLF